MPSSFYREQSPAGDHNGRSGNRRLPVINGLRGLAIIAVIAHHVVTTIYTRHDLQDLPSVLSTLVTNGWSGVNLFFILSGFVLFLPRATSGGTMSQPGEWLAFYRRRGMRLLPLFYLAAIGTWALAAARGSSVDLGELWSVLSLRFIFDPASFAPSFNIPLWSLGDEIAFSALFPLLILGIRRYGATGLTVIFVGVALATRYVGLSNSPALGPTFNANMFVCRLDEFMLGMALAHVYATGWVPRRPGLWAMAGAALVTLSWAGCDLLLRDAAALPIFGRAFLSDILDAGLAALVCAALVPGTRLAAALSWRPLQIAGVMCYSLYIWHFPLLSWLMPDSARMPNTTLAVALLSFLGLTVAIATFSYRLIERPLSSRPGHGWAVTWLRLPRGSVSRL